MMTLLDTNNTGLLVVDVQEKLMQVMGRRQQVIDNIVKLLHLSQLYKHPITLTEQYPKWLGPTLPEITAVIPTYEPISKMHFNCCDEDGFIERLDSQGLKNIIITGVEAHICIYQTCVSILERGYAVHVPQDAVDSRTSENLRVGLDLMDKAGAFITSTETVIYQILKKAGTSEFKKMLKLMK
jgi:nicotinamidase-related amidase